MTVTSDVHAEEQGKEEPREGKRVWNKRRPLKSKKHLLVDGWLAGRPTCLDFIAVQAWITSPLGSCEGNPTPNTREFSQLSRVRPSHLSKRNYLFCYLAWETLLYLFHPRQAIVNSFFLDSHDEKTKYEWRNRIQQSKIVGLVLFQQGWR